VRAREVVAAWQDDAAQTLDGIRAWFALYRPQLSRSAAQALETLLNQHSGEER
jgi:hypothetical protein